MAAILVIFTSVADCARMYFPSEVTLIRHHEYYEENPNAGKIVFPSNHLNRPQYARDILNSIPSGLKPSKHSTAVPQKLAPYKSTSSYVTVNAETLPTAVTDTEVTADGTAEFNTPDQTYVPPELIVINTETSPEVSPSTEQSARTTIEDVTDGKEYVPPPLIVIDRNPTSDPNISTPQTFTKITTKTKPETTTEYKIPEIIVINNPTDDIAPLINWNVEPSDNGIETTTESSTDYVVVEAVDDVSPTDKPEDWFNHQRNGECDANTVCYKESGACEEIFETGSCNSDEWLVLTSEGLPKCERRQCEQGQFLFHNDSIISCVHTAEVECTGGSELLLMGNGHLQCVCPEGTGWYQDHCHKVTDKELCGTHSFMEFDNNGNIKCSKNVTLKSFISSLPLMNCRAPRYYRDSRGVCKRKSYMRVSNYWRIMMFGRNNLLLQKTKCV